MARHLEWDGCFNARDLGGLPVAGGGVTRRGALVRADALDGLSADGWAAAWAHGVRTVVDLRNDDEIGVDRASRPAGITTHRVPLDASEDREFWDVWSTGPQFGTPLYYRPHLERFPERTAAVVAAISGAGPGGVVFHCGGGRDRAGQVAMVVLHLAGVAPEQIAADYLLSVKRLAARQAARGEADEGPELEAHLRERGTTAREVIAATLAGLDVEALLLGAGLLPNDLSALSRRLLGDRR